VDKIDTEIGFRLTCYNFVVLFRPSQILNVSVESSNVLSGHNI
jgi:hypothetical protein